MSLTALLLFSLLRQCSLECAPLSAPSTGIVWCQYLTLKGISDSSLLLPVVHASLSCAIVACVMPSYSDTSGVGSFRSAPLGERSRKHRHCIVYRTSPLLPKHAIHLPLSPSHLSQQYRAGWMSALLPTAAAIALYCYLVTLSDTTKLLPPHLQLPADHPQLHLGFGVVPSKVAQVRAFAVLGHRILWHGIWKTLDSGIVERPRPSALRTTK